MQVLPRLAVTLALAFASAGYTDYVRQRLITQPSDLEQPRLAAELLIDGRDPYTEIGPDGPVRHPFAFIYPAPAAIVAAPFAALPDRLGDALFMGLGAGLLAWGLTRRTIQNPQLLVFASSPMFMAAQNVQWSPWLTAAMTLPCLGFVYACKPSVALAYLVASPSPLAWLMPAGLTLVTILVWPWWVLEWFSVLPSVTHMSVPVLRWGGPLLLLGLLRWRRPEARMLVALACIPQTPVMYTVLPLFLAVRTVEEGLFLMVASHAVTLAHPGGATGAGYDAWMAANGQWMVYLFYLPCLAMILLRPNEASGLAPSFTE